MALKDIRGEKALDALCALLDPVTKIMQDKEMRPLMERANKGGAIKRILSEHKHEIIEILAILDGEDPKEYADKITILTLPMKLIELFNDEELTQFFSAQSRNDSSASSGSVTGNTEGKEK